jgi:chromosome segregation protein
MTDIIFAGAKDRKQATLCEVTLVFNNKDKILNTEYQEVAITRRLYRDQQENEYFINKERCRLKDIRYLMMNTGLGKNSFSIVSQGSINQLSDAKPTERKTIFEEAAGVSIYKDQKNESVRKLDRTMQNLNIIEVSVQELKKQVTPLEKQAAKAKVYLEKRKILEKYEVSLIAEELKVDVTEIETINKEIKTAQLEKDLKSNLVNTNQSKTSNINQKLILLEDEINSLEKEQRDTQAKINSLSKGNQGEVNQEVGKDNISNLIDEILQEATIIDDQIDKSTKAIESIISQKGNAQQLVQETLNNIESKKYEMARHKFEKESIESKLKHSNHLANGPGTIIKNKQMFPEVVDVVGNLFNVDSRHELAIQTALGYSGAQNVVVKTDKAIKKIINFLKEGRYGRATFLPLNVIKVRRVDDKSMTILKHIKGFEGIASDIIKYKTDVDAAMKFLLGNNIIFDNLDNAIEASKLLDGRYKIITLDGEVINPGFSVTGGTKSSRAKTLNLDSKLEVLIKDIKKIEEEVNKDVVGLDVHRATVDELQEQHTIKNTTLARLDEKKVVLDRRAVYLKTQYKSIMGKDFAGAKGSKAKTHSMASLTALLSEINEQLEVKSKLRIKYVKEQQEISTSMSG